MNPLVRFIQSSMANPWTCLFFALFALAEYANWQKGTDLTHLCGAVNRTAGLAINCAARRQSPHGLVADQLVCPWGLWGDKS